MEKYYRFCVAVSIPLTVLYSMVAIIDGNIPATIAMPFATLLMYKGWKGRFNEVSYWKKWSFYFSQFIFIGLIVSVLFFLTHPAEAQSGCCSWHGGVDYCDTSVGTYVCNDGTYSPSCGCTYIPPKPEPVKSFKTVTVSTIKPEKYCGYGDVFDTEEEANKSIDELNFSIKASVDEKEAISKENGDLKNQISSITQERDKYKKWNTWIFWILILSIWGNFSWFFKDK